MSDDEDKKGKKKKKEDGGEERAYTGTKTPADLAFAEWVCRQWARGEHLERIDVCQYFTRGPMKDTFGDIRDFEIFPSGHRVDMEEAVELTNRLIGSCQRVVNRIEKKPSTFFARAFDRGRAAVGRDGEGDPVDTFPIELSPNRIYRFDGSNNLDADGEGATPQTLSLEYLRTSIGALHRDRDRDDANIGDLIVMFLDERREARAYERQLKAENRQIMNDWVAAIREREAALMGEEDRKLSREITRLKIDGIRGGAKWGKNILTSLIGGGEADQKSLPAHAPAPTNGEARVVSKITKERMLLDNFFQDCKSAKIDDALFGTWEPGEGGKPRQTKPGIFTAEQFNVLLRVHGGYLTAEALDDLLPEYLGGKKNPLTVTPQQIAAAQALEGMTDAIGISLVQLFRLRVERASDTGAAATPTAEPAAAAAQAPHVEIVPVNGEI